MCTFHAPEGGGVWQENWKLNHTQHSAVDDAATLTRKKSPPYPLKLMSDEALLLSCSRKWNSWNINIIHHWTCWRSCHLATWCCSQCWWQWKEAKNTFRHTKEKKNAKTLKSKLLVVCVICFMVIGWGYFFSFFCAISTDQTCHHDEAWHTQPAWQLHHEYCQKCQFSMLHMVFWVLHFIFEFLVACRCC